MCQEVKISKTAQLLAQFLTEHLTLERSRKSQRLTRASTHSEEKSTNHRSHDRKNLEKLHIRCDRPRTGAPQKGRTLSQHKVKRGGGVGGGTVTHRRGGSSRLRRANSAGDAEQGGEGAEGWERGAAPGRPNPTDVTSRDRRSASVVRRPFVRCARTPAHPPSADHDRPFSHLRKTIRFSVAVYFAICSFWWNRFRFGI